MDRRDHAPMAMAGNGFDRTGVKIVRIGMMETTEDRVTSPTESASGRVLDGV